MLVLNNITTSKCASYRSLQTLIESCLSTLKFSNFIHMVSKTYMHRCVELLF